MGLFDFAIKPGQRFNKEEIRILDQNFNSISAYTKRKFKFDRKDIADNINGSTYGIDNHKITYLHIDTQLTEWDSEYLFPIDCLKLFVKTERNYKHGLKGFFDNGYDDGPKIKVPIMTKFPTFALQVGWLGNGFITEFKYDSNGATLTKKCVDEIEKNTIKFLKKL